MRQDVLVRIHKDFKKTLDEMYPDTRGLSRKTEKLNRKLKELMYEKDR